MPTLPSNTTILNQCIHFLNSIGIPTVFRKIEGDSFLPGLLIENGSIVIDAKALLHPGDILHEADPYTLTLFREPCNL